MQNLNYRESIYKQAFIKFGENSQIACAIEEMSELNVELCKLLNGKQEFNNPDHLAKLIDELADVSIMLEQIQYQWKLRNLVTDRVLIKIERLRTRIMDE